MNFKNLAGRAATDKAYNIAKSPKHHGYQRDLASVVYTVFDEKNSGRGIKNKNISNNKLVKKKKKSTITFYCQNLWC